MEQRWFINEKSVHSSLEFYTNNQSILDQYFLYLSY